MKGVTLSISTQAPDAFYKDGFEVLDYKEVGQLVSGSAGKSNYFTCEKNVGRFACYGKGFAYSSGFGNRSFNHKCKLKSMSLRRVKTEIKRLERL